MLYTEDPYPCYLHSHPHDYTLNGEETNLQQVHWSLYTTLHVALLVGIIFLNQTLLCGVLMAQVSPENAVVIKKIFVR